MNAYASLFLVAHVLLCIVLGLICICRLNNDVCRQHKRARFRVLLVMAAVLLSLFQPFIFGTRATPTETLLVLAVAISMALNASRWMQSYGMDQQSCSSSHDPTPSSSEPQRSTS